MHDSAKDELLKAAGAGDSNALQRLIVDCHEPLRRMLAREMPPTLQSHIEPEDLLQQAYVAAFQASEERRFDGHGHFYRWLETTARRKLADAQRAAVRQKRDVRRNLGLRPRSTSCPELIGTLIAQQSTPSQHVAKAELAAAVMTSLARLTDDQRTVICMRFLEGRAVADVARSIGKGESAVHMLTHRGLSRLRELLGVMARLSTTT